MKVETFKGGYDRNFSYLIYDKDSSEAIIIDPFENIDIYFDKASELGVKIKGYLNTHGHHDHVEGNKKLEEKGISKIKNLMLGDEEIEFIKTPGHTDDSVCFLIDKKIFTGDTLFVGKVGGTWSEEGTKKQAESLKKLMNLNENIKVYPGHDFGEKPVSTIGYEKENNPFIKHLNESFEKFVWLKENWKEYKKEHGLK